MLPSNTTPRRTVHIFDFDDTMAITKGQVYVFNSITKLKFFLSPKEFAVYAPEPGDNFDFSDFIYLRHVRPIHENIHRAQKQYQKHGPGGVIILTARGSESGNHILDFISKFGLNNVRVVGLGGPNKPFLPEHKAMWIKEFLLLNPQIDKIIFTDDSWNNISAVSKLKTDSDLHGRTIIVEHYNHSV